MKHFFAFLLLSWVSCSGALLAGQDNKPVGARAAGLGNAAITLNDVWSVHHNQAGLGQIRQLTAGVYYESRFLMPELALNSAVLAIPMGQGAWGVSVRNYGFRLYQENKIGIAYGRRFGDLLSIGMQLNWHATRFSEYYGAASAFTVEAGAQYRAGKRVILAAHIFNPGQAKFAEFDDERIPAAIRFGMQYRFSKQVLMVGEIENSMYQKPVLRAGIEYMPSSVLYVRAGVSGNPINSCFGFGLRWKKFQMDMAGTFHPVLGFTPKFSLTFQPGENE